MTAICKDCGQDMQEATTCTRSTITLKKGEYERDRFHFSEESGKCHDCGIEHGGIHHVGCDVERCPECKGQLITCYCWE